MKNIKDLFTIHDEKNFERMMLILVIWLAWIPFSVDITVIMIPIVICFFIYFKIVDYYNGTKSIDK